MKRTVSVMLIATAGLIIGAGLLWARGAQAMNVKLNIKDLPEYGLRVITSADPSFEGRLASRLKGHPGDMATALKPFSFFIENKSKQTVVAYALQWCFTKADGTNSYQRETYGDHTALMEGTVFSDKYEDQSAWIKPNAARFFSMVSPNGSSLIRVPVSRDEAEQIKQGARFSESELLQRYASELSKYVNVTVSIDGAFFDDGTFVGDDSTGFFAATNAQVEARHDLLNEMALGLSKNTKREVFNQVEVVADQPDVTLTSDSTPTDHYNFWKKFYAKNVLAIRNTYGEENGMTAALYPRQKPWRKLQKKEPLK